MKKFYVLFIVMLVFTLVISCGSSAKVKAPNWVNEKVPDDVIWGIGFAKLENSSLGMELATTRAQRDAARQISAIVQAMLVDYANESGLSSNPRSLVAIENIGRNLINMNITGSAINAREQMSDGTWFVRISLSKSEASRQANAAARNELANYAEFRADQALRQLDYQIRNTPSTPEPNGSY
ncbi:MAG: hypothetical protein FWC22_03620 [Treponema sp.]|nr:hypothetical protein [Treponema sp.]